MATSKPTGRPSAPGAAGTPTRAAELALVDRCRRGDLGAFEELYRAHAGTAVQPGGPDARQHRRMPRTCCRRFFCRRTGSWRASAASRRSGRGCTGWRRTRSWTTSAAARRATGQLTDGLDDASVLADALGHRLADRAIDRIDLERALARAARRVPRRVRAARRRRAGAQAKSPRCWASRKGRRSRRCTRRGCGCEELVWRR